MTVSSKNRDRLVTGDVAARFPAPKLQGERIQQLQSGNHFWSDGAPVKI